MAINVLRSETAVFTTVVNAVKENNPIAKSCKHTDKLVKLLDMNEALPEIAYDVAAFDACRANNLEKCAQPFAQAPFGGNKEALDRLVGMPVPAEQCTMSKYESTSGMGIIALQLILDFDRHTSSPLLKPDVTRVGLSVKPCQSCVNLIQFLYVMIPMKPPT